MYVRETDVLYIDENFDLSDKTGGIFDKNLVIPKENSMFV